MADTSTSKAGGGSKRKKRTRRLWLWLSLAVLVLAGGGAGGWIVVNSGASDGDYRPILAERQPPRDASYVRMAPLHIPIEMANGKRRRLVIVIWLEVDAAKDHYQRVYDVLPRLRQAFVRALTERPLPGADTGQPELVHVKNRIRAASVRMLGPRVVHDVLVQDVHILRA